MREYFVIKNDGVGMIINASNDDEARSKAGKDILSIEETEESKDYNGPEKIERTEAYTPVIIKAEPKKTEFTRRVDRLISVANGNFGLTTNEKNLIFGVKKSINNHKDISSKQKESIDRLYVRLIG